MKQWMDALKSARKIEILIIAAAICALLVLQMRSGPEPVANADEVRMERILSRIEGAGEVNVMIAADAQGAVQGVVVAASGADDVRVMLEIQRAVRTLTGLELEEIEVVKSEG